MDIQEERRASGSIYVLWRMGSSSVSATNSIHLLPISAWKPCEKLFLGFRQFEQGAKDKTREAPMTTTTSLASTVLLSLSSLAVSQWFGLASAQTAPTVQRLSTVDMFPNQVPIRVRSHRVQHCKKIPTSLVEIGLIVGDRTLFCNVLGCVLTNKNLLRKLNWTLKWHQPGTSTSTSSSPAQHWHHMNGKWRRDDGSHWCQISESRDQLLRHFQKNIHPKPLKNIWKGRLRGRLWKPTNSTGFVLLFSLFYFFFFFLSPQLMPVGNSSRPSAGMSPPRHALQCAKGLTQPLPKAVRTKSTTSFSTEKHPRWFLSAFNGHFLLSSWSWHRLIPRH